MLEMIGNVQFDPYRGCANTRDLLSTAFRVAAHGVDGWMCTLQMLLLVWDLVCSRPLGEAASLFASTFWSARYRCAVLAGPFLDWNFDS